MDQKEVGWIIQLVQLFLLCLLLKVTVQSNFWWIREVPNFQIGQYKPCFKSSVFYCLAHYNPFLQHLGITWDFSKDTVLENEVNWPANLFTQFSLNKHRLNGGWISGTVFCAFQSYSSWGCFIFLKGRGLYQVLRNTSQMKINYVLEFPSWRSG